MTATLIGMPSIAQVASSWLVIWKQPSPSIAQTTEPGKPTCAPMAAGRRSPSCRPTGVEPLPRALEVDVVRGPHLVLADTGA